MTKFYKTVVSFDSGETTETNWFHSEQTYKAHIKEVIEELNGQVESVEEHSIPHWMKSPTFHQSDVRDYFVNFLNTHATPNSQE